MATADCIPRRRDFTNARANAKRRNIPWNLDFQAWADAWVASGKFLSRGRKRGQFQMDRIRNDRGYEPGNIQIVAGHINRTKDSPHGWRPKLTEEAVIDIRTNLKKHVRGWSYFAKKYGVSISAIKLARSGINWRQVE